MCWKFESASLDFSFSVDITPNTRRGCLNWWLTKPLFKTYKNHFSTCLFYSGGVAAVPEETAHSGMMRGRKRVMRGGRGGSQHSKRGRRSSGGGTDHALATLPNMSNIANMPNPEMIQPRPIEVEKPDANMRLKVFTLLGLNFIREHLILNVGIVCLSWILFYLTFPYALTMALVTKIRTKE